MASKSGLDEGSSNFPKLEGGKDGGELGWGRGETWGDMVGYGWGERRRGCWALGGILVALWGYNVL